LVNGVTQPRLLVYVVFVVIVGFEPLVCVYVPIDQEPVSEIEVADAGCARAASSGPATSAVAICFLHLHNVLLLQKV
jgi:hypothetical protein